MPSIHLIRITIKNFLSAVLSGCSKKSQNPLKSGSRIDGSFALRWKFVIGEKLWDWEWIGLHFYICWGMGFSTLHFNSK